MAVVSRLPPLRVAVAVLFVAVGLLGMGNGAVFQLVPQRFADRVGLITGVAGAAGGLGGFFLPSMLGAAKDAGGTYGLGLLLVAAAFGVGALALLQLGTFWAKRWQPRAVKQAGVFCYRGLVRSILGEETA